MIFLFFTSIVFVTCQSKKEADVNSFSSVKPSEIVGDDIDSNGCRASAGYQYSIVKNGCIRVWEDGFRFELIDSSEFKDQANSIFLILSDDKRKAEVIFGGAEKPAIMNAMPFKEGETKPVLFSNDIEGIELEYKKGLYWILINGKRFYSIATKDLERFEKGLN